VVTFLQEFAYLRKSGESGEIFLVEIGSDFDVSSFVNSSAGIDPLFMFLRGFSTIEPEVQSIKTVLPR